MTVQQRDLDQDAAVEAAADAAEAFTRQLGNRRLTRQQEQLARRAEAIARVLQRQAQPRRSRR